MTRENANDEKHIKMICNNNFHCYISDGTHAIEAMLELGMEQLKYMSADAIKNWIYSALDTAEEMTTWKKDISLKKRISIYRKTLENITDRDNLTMFYVNTMLACDGMSTLSGFGMANVASDGGRSKAKSKILTNPEKRSIY